MSSFYICTYICETTYLYSHAAMISLKHKFKKEKRTLLLLTFIFALNFLSILFVVWLDRWLDGSGWDLKVKTIEGLCWVEWL